MTSQAKDSVLWSVSLIRWRRGVRLRLLTIDQLKLNLVVATASGGSDGCPDNFANNLDQYIKEAHLAGHSGFTRSMKM